MNGPEYSVSLFGLRMVTEPSRTFVRVESIHSTSEGIILARTARQGSSLLRDLGPESEKGGHVEIWRSPRGRYEVPELRFTCDIVKHAGYQELLYDLEESGSGSAMERVLLRGATRKLTIDIPAQDLPEDLSFMLPKPTSPKEVGVYRLLLQNAAHQYGEIVVELQNTALTAAVTVRRAEGFSPELEAKILAYKAAGTVPQFVMDSALSGLEALTGYKVLRIVSGDRRVRVG